MSRFRRREKGVASKIGVFSVLFGQKPFEETLDYIVDLGLGAVEIGTGAYPGNAHANPAALLASDRRLKAFREAINRRNLVDQRVQLPRQPAASARANREGPPQGVRTDRRAGGEARRRDGHQVGLVVRRHVLHLRPVGTRGGLAEVEELRLLLQHLVDGRLDVVVELRCDPIAGGLHARRREPRKVRAPGCGGRGEAPRGCR